MPAQHPQVMTINHMLDCLAFLLLGALLQVGSGPFASKKCCRLSFEVKFDFSSSSMGYSYLEMSFLVLSSLLACESAQHY